MEHFGTRLQRALDRKGMSIRELHRRLQPTEVPGRSYPQIHRYLRGSPEPPLEFTRAVATLLEVRAPWLALGDGEMAEAAQAANEFDASLQLEALEALGGSSRSKAVEQLFLAVLKRRARLYPKPSEVTTDKLLEFAWELAASVKQPMYDFSGGRSFSDAEREDYQMTMLFALLKAMPEGIAGALEAGRPAPARVGKGPKILEELGA